MDQKPFDHVYFTGMVRDKQGRKMSKSLGNSPDLLDLIDRFGADAVRFGILISAPAGNDLLFDDSSCDQGRNFNNKIWNALKLVKMWEANGVVTYDRSAEDFEKATFAATWFEARLKAVKAEVEDLYKDFRLSEALKTIYSLVWDDFCSWYLEWVKPPFGEKIDGHLLTCTLDYFEELMQLLHPFMPFVTEEIYHRLRPRENGDDLTIRQQGEVGTNHVSISQLRDEDALVLGRNLQEIITAIRDTRSKAGLKPRENITLHVQTATPEQFANIESLLAKQVAAGAIQYVSDAVPNTYTVVVGTNKFYVESEQAMDTEVQKEKLQKDLEYQRGFLLSVEKKLSNERFVQNAKPEVVEAERRKKQDAEEKIRAIEESLANL
jgi:valyl-tRNA synthetase